MFGDVSDRIRSGNAVRAMLFAAAYTRLALTSLVCCTLWVGYFWVVG